jgi:hypothetical protein
MELEAASDLPPPVADSGVLAELQHLLGRLPEGTVFAPPVEQGGVTVIPAARVHVRGGEGRGEGRGEPKEGGRKEGGPKEGGPEEGAREEPGWGRGWGRGVVASAAPVGALVISQGRVEWVPAPDPNRINHGWQAVAAIAAVSLGRALHRRGRWRRLR